MPISNSELMAPIKENKETLFSVDKELELLMAEYLNVEDCIACGMGFATNALNIPTLVRKVISTFL